MMAMQSTLYVSALCTFVQPNSNKADIVIEDVFEGMRFLCIAKSKCFP